MIIAGLFVSLFGLVSASWNNPALAQTVGLLPTETAVVAPRAALIPCDEDLVLYDIFDAKIASATLAPVPPEGNWCSLLQVVPETNAGFPVTFPELQIDALGLFTPSLASIPAAPAGYTRITDAVQFAGYKGSSLRMCFVLPANYTSYQRVRIAYFDVTPTINRWVYLSTGTPTAKADGTTEVCMNRGLRSPIPAVFAVFGQN
jgi:hypothetical protein